MNGRPSISATSFASAVKDVVKPTVIDEGEITFFYKRPDASSMYKRPDLKSSYIVYEETIQDYKSFTSGITDFKSSFPASTVVSNSSTLVNITRGEYDSSGSVWGTSYSEDLVADTLISSQDWDLRVGKGGQIYSLKTDALGETIPPQYNSNDIAPWVDEVWQTVSVYDNQPNTKFNHSSGVYLHDPILTEPYYTPRLVTETDVDNKSLYTMNWMQPSGQGDAYADNNRSHIINLTKYKDLGDGVIEVTLGVYNFGNTEVYRYHNMPWGGVRRTALEYNYLANSDQNSYTQVTGYFGENGAGSARLENIKDTGGWTVFCSENSGDYGESLGFVFGKDDKINSDTYASSRIRQGYAYPLAPQEGEADWRNYMVSTVNRMHYVSQGEGIWSRFYLVFGNNRDNVRDKILSRSLVNNTSFEEMNNLESESSLIGYKVSLTDGDFTIEKSDNPDFYLYEQLINKGVPLFEIVKTDGTRFVTWNPYTSGTTKFYDGSVKEINLLGFSLMTNDATSDYNYDTLDNIFSEYSSYYNSDNESLSVRIS